ncbi:MAG: hypothetical protein IKS12_04320 [Eubacterium sp.]|nr:hypothetical protein [Eubacterium sp.]
MKKVISLFLSILILFSVLQTVPYTALADGVETLGTLTQGVPAEVKRELNERKFYYYSFVPEEDGLYLISTHDETVQYIIPALFDENLEVVDDSVYQRDKNNTRQATRAFSGDLKAGKTYYVGVYILLTAATTAYPLATVTVSKHTHSFAHGICTVCEKKDPDYTPTVNTLETNVTFENEFVAPGEIQYYTYTPEVSGCYHITLSKNYDYNYTIKNSAGEKVVARNTGVYTDLEGGETYSVEINHSEKKLGAYTFTVSYHEHSFVHGYCKTCSRYDPDYVAPVPELELGVPCEGELTRTNEINEFTFTPDTDGSYKFSYDDKDVMVKMTLLDGKDSLFSSTYYPQYAQLEAGKTYTLQISWWTSYSAGPYTVLAEKHEHEFHNGYCSVCKAKDESYVVPTVPLEIDTYYDDEIFSTPEVHHFSFTTDEAGLYNIDTDNITPNPHTLGSLTVYVYDGNGNKVDKAARYNRYWCYNLEANTAYTFTVQVYEGHPFTGTFKVRYRRHTHRLSVTGTEKATCKTEGKKAYQCPECGYTTEEILPVDPDGHQFVNGTCRLCNAVDESYVKTVKEAKTNIVYYADAYYGGETKYFSFTPEEDGVYEFGATPWSNSTAIFELFDENENRVMKFSASSSTTGYAELEAGKTYVLAITLKNDDNGVNFTIKKHAHSYKTETKAATCEETGYVKRSCKCGDFTAEYTEATGLHSFKETVVKPTCIENGYTFYECTVCRFSYYTSYVPADPDAHHFVNGICDECGAVQSGYEFTDLKLNRSTSFTFSNEDDERYFRYVPKETGYYTIKSSGRADPYCELYDEEMNWLDDADDISDSNYNFELSAYFEKDKPYYLCVGIYDGVNKKITLKVTTHTHKYETETVAPTCGSMGATIKYCACGDYEITDVKEATGAHTYRLEEIVEPTCIDKGYTVYACSVCGDSYTDNEKAPTGVHEYENKICVNCGAKQQSTNRVFESVINPGDSIPVTFTTKDDVAYFTFVPEFGGSYTFETSGFADTYIVLTDEDGKTVAEDDDSAPAENARINAMFLAGRVYTFAVDVLDLKECTFTAKLYAHTHSFVSFTVPATCVDKGYTEYTCTECFYSTTGSYTQPTGVHSYSGGICEECGSIDTSYGFDAFKDGETKTVSGNSLKVYSFVPFHSGEGELCLAMGLGAIVILDKNGNPLAPTDENQTITDSVKTNFVKGEKYFIAVYPLLTTVAVSLNCSFAHTFEPYTVPSTCTVKGYTCNKCTLCGKEEDKTELDLAEHNYVYEELPPTCMYKGYTCLKCTVCGREKDRTETEMVDHDFVEEYVAPNCTFAGHFCMKCRYCGLTKNYTEIPANGVHEFTDHVIAPTYYSEGLTVHFCKICCYEYTDNVVPPLDLKLKRRKIKKIKAGKKSLRVWWNADSDAEGYEIQYSASRKFKKRKTIRVKGKNKAYKKLKRLKSGKKYYVRVRSVRTINGRTYRSKWSKKKAVTVK